MSLVYGPALRCGRQAVASISDCQKIPVTRLKSFSSPKNQRAGKHRAILLRIGAFTLGGLIAQMPVALGHPDGSATSVATSAHAVADSDGTVHVPGFDLPLSIYISAEAKRSLVEQLRAPQFDPNAVTADKVAALRESVNKYLAPMLKRMQERYPVNIGQQVLSGIHAYSVISKSGIAARNRDRVLINLHGGGFMVGDSGTIGLLESIPIAALSQIQVITIDYRQGPEYQFPAASEDVAAVYRELLNRFEPQNIGIYGCSAGGLLAAEATAWIQKQHLPRPGAIGVLCASADARWAGDAYFTVPALTGRPPPSPGAPPNYDEKYYYGNNDLTNPLMSPITSPTVLAAFPPTLILTATRAGEFSAAVHTDTELIKAGVTSELHVWDGMWHGFYMDPDLPESQDLAGHSALTGERLISRKPGSSGGKDEYVVDYTTSAADLPTRFFWGIPDTANPGLVPLKTAALDSKSLTYTSAPLTRDSELTGFPRVHLFASSTALDQDFFVYLEDVDDGGSSALMTEGIIRASNRATRTPPFNNGGLPWHPSLKEDQTALTPGVPASLEFALYPMSNYVRKGHRIRLTVNNFDRGAGWDTPEISPAPTVSIYHDAQHPSSITLPFVAKDLGPTVARLRGSQKGPNRRARLSQR